MYLFVCAILIYLFILFVYNALYWFKQDFVFFLNEFCHCYRYQISYKYMKLKLKKSQLKQNKKYTEYLTMILAATVTAIIHIFYDPTVFCPEQSNQFTSGYCDYASSSGKDTSKGYRCDDDDYSYDCDSNTYSNDGFYRWRCSPSDLSGKYGAIDIEDSVVFDFDISGFDDLMIPMNFLAGKSVGLQCSDEMNIIACAAFVDYTYVFVCFFFINKQINNQLMPFFHLFVCLFNLLQFLLLCIVFSVFYDQIKMIVVSLYLLQSKQSNIAFFFVYYTFFLGPCILKCDCIETYTKFKHKNKTKTGMIQTMKARMTMAIITKVQVIVIVAVTIQQY